MACDTFIKISVKCKKHFAIHQPGELGPFVNEIISRLPEIIADLRPQQIHTVYEAIGHMINAQPDRAEQGNIIKNFMALPNGAVRNV